MNTAYQISTVDTGRMIAHFDFHIKLCAHRAGHDVGRVVHPSTREAHDELVTLIGVREEPCAKACAVDDAATCGPASCL